MNRIVTIFKSLKDVSAGFNRDVLSVLDRIKQGKSKEIIDQIRQLPDEKGKELKKALPGVCFNGSFKHRSVSGLIKHSGLMICDIDNLQSLEHAIEERNIASQDKYTFAAWVSPSGRGVKLLIKIPAEHERHKAYFQCYRDYLNHPHWDDSGSDVSRFCFESYDPDIYINIDSEIWLESAVPDVNEIGTSKPTIALTSENRIISNLMEWWQKKFGANKGSRNTNLYKLAIAFNDFGVSRSDAEYQLSNFKETDFTDNEIQSIIRSAYSKQDQFGTKFFEDKEAQIKIEKQIRAGKKKKEITQIFPDIDKRTISEYIDSVKELLDIDEFWYYDENNKIKLSIHKFKFWLEQNNFFKYYPSENSNTYSFIKRDQNMLEETDANRIKDFTLQYILNKPNVGFAPYDYMAGNAHYFNHSFLSMLDTTTVALKEDTKDACYIFYRNCAIEITKSEIKEIDYIDIDGFVWKNQIINRDFKKADHHDAEYRKFIWLISGKDPNRYNSLKSVIGYLMHSFKTSANNKAIIFNDETISENPNGGSGKGLFWNALKHINKVVSIDGKTFDFNKSFPYQLVSTDTQILVFDDVKKNFNFEHLFSLITEGITLEYKGQTAVQIPVEQSPKILITTNYTLGGVGGSHERRKFEIEMSDYFSYKHTPQDEFGHMLFSGWDEEEWLRFDNYMVNCEQYYLTHGLVSSEYTNLEVRKLIKETSFEFYQWAKEGALKENERLDKNMYFNLFIEEYTDMKRWLTQRVFTRWVHSWAKYKNIEIIEGRTANTRWFKLGDGANEDDCPF